MIKYFFTAQFIRFLGVGGLAACIHWSSRILLSTWLPFSSAVGIAYVIGMLMAFILNRFFVFPNSEKSMLSQILYFIIVNLSFFPVVWGACLSIDNILQEVGLGIYSEAIAHGIAISIPMFATFLFYKFFAFKEYASTDIL